MAKTEDEIRDDRKKRIKNTKSEKHLIKEDASKNALDGKVIDVYDIINRSSDPIIIRLRKLREFGITDEKIAETYSDLAGNIENESTAIETLDAVFKKIAIAISQQPNGIVINLNTGDLNKEASLRQAQRVGILDSDCYEHLKEKGQKELFKSFREDKSNAVKQNELKENFSKAFSGYNFGKDFQEYLGKDVNSLKISNNAKEMLKKVRADLTKEDPRLMKLYRLEVMLDDAKNTPEYDVILKQRDRFLKDNPEYQKKQESLRDEKGFIKPEVVSRYNRFNNNLKVNCLLSEIAMLNDKDVNTLSPEQRQSVIISALAGMSYGRSTDEKSKLHKECWKALEKLNPDLKDKRNDFKGRLYEFLQKELGLKEDLTPDKFRNLMDICNESVDKGLDYEKCIETLKVNDKDFDKYYKENAKEINIQTEIENNGKTNVERYFATSKIKFSKTDEKNFNDVYKDCTVESWIDNKKDALILDYATLVRTKEKLSYDKENTFNKKKIGEIEAKLEEFNEKHPDIKKLCEDKNGNLKEDINQKAENYKNKMIESALLKFYSVDILAENNGKGYQDLDDAHKKAYIRNILVGLNYGEKSSNKSILKLAQRRLELLNTEDKTFISFDNNGNPIVNQAAILDEYSSISKHKWTSFDELSISAEARKDSYIIKKLDEYEKLQEEDFIVLENPENKDKALAQIESIKAKSNQLKSKGLESNPKVEESYTIEIDDKSNGFLNRLKNLFKPKITDGNTGKENNGLFSRIFNKITGNSEKAEVSGSNEETQKFTSVMDDYIVNNQNSEIEHTAMQSKNNRQENQIVQESQYDRNDL